MTPDFDIKIGSTDPEWIIPGPSSLYFIASGGAVLDSPFRYAIPENLMKLLDMAAEGSEEHVKFLSRVVLEDHPDREQLPIDVIVAHLRGFFAELYELDHLTVIRDEDVDPVIEEAIIDSFEEGGYDISLSPKKNFIRDYFARALSWSKKTGAVLIESTKKSFVALGDYIVSLQLPQKADALVKDKQRFVNRVFRFSGGKSVKWVLGLTIAVSGLAYPPLGVIGVGIAFIDP